MHGLAIKIFQLITLRWLTGPIFTKELRVSSRRKRFYFMRTLYLLLLLLLMSLIWFEATRAYNSVTYNVSRMAEASKLIVVSIVWFQFIAFQVLAVILCSTAINQEIYNRTLYALMTTPITSMQIIMGKLLSRLWQILILFAVSLPLLSMIRVFGGIPWDYLLLTACITFCVVIFISSVTVFFSILFRRSYAVMIFTVVTLGIFFALLPALFLFICHELNKFGTHSIDFEDIGEQVFFFTNPYVLMAVKTDNMFYSSAPSLHTHWPFQCIFLLICSFLTLCWASFSVRSSALRHMTPKTTRKKYKVPPRESRSYWLFRPFFLHSIVRRRIGTGMIWKEFLLPVLGKFRKIVYLAFLLIVISLAISAFAASWLNSSNILEFVFGSSVIGLFSLACLFTVIVPATFITSEKEASTWAILLTTCYSDYQILGGKIVGILRRIIIVWFPFIVIYFMVAYVSLITVPTSIMLIMVGAVAAIFVIFSGLYFSSCFKNSTTAVIANLSLVAVFWVLIPLVVPPVLDIFIGRYNAGYHTITRLYLDITPPGMFYEIMKNAPSSSRSWSSFRQLLGISMPVWYVMLHLLMCGLFFWRTKVNMRKKIS
ncbi:MAG: ABC transporter permease subunit [Anaerohalosphaera sp.]|nr:ABC transporter permease subunit [Anaerohalosphaera sp.]